MFCNVRKKYKRGEEEALLKGLSILGKPIYNR
jgi:hypothetical protein